MRTTAGRPPIFANLFVLGRPAVRAPIDPSRMPLRHPILSIWFLNSAFRSRTATGSESRGIQKEIRAVSCPSLRSRRYTARASEGL